MPSPKKTLATGGLGSRHKLSTAVAGCGGWRARSLGALGGMERRWTGCACHCPRHRLIPVVPANAARGQRWRAPLDRHPPHRGEPPRGPLLQQAGTLTHRWRPPRRQADCRCCGDPTHERTTRTAPRDSRFDREHDQPRWLADRCVRDSRCDAWMGSA